MIENLPVNSVITYNDICDALEIFDINACRAYFFRAVKELEVEQQRTMENVREVGYRVVAAREHERLVRKDVRSIKRKARKAISKAINVRREELSNEERAKIDALQLKLAQTQEMIHRLESRKADKAEVKAFNAQANDRIDELEKRLTRFMSERKV